MTQVKKDISQQVVIIDFARTFFVRKDGPIQIGIMHT